MVRSDIKPLSEETIDRIAAGEVVERPASVVKELVENAIDAGADAISVEITGGGIDSIRITDNGMGIPRDQIRSAFLRHYTSKLRNADDLLNISSLGFRGEALASIAAVSKLELYTKAREEAIGSLFTMEGGVEVDMVPTGAPDGSTFFIKNLFYNTPARAKFLRSPMTEGNYIQDLLEKMALSRSDISFKFRSNGRDRFQTPGNGSMYDTVYSLFGRSIASELLPLETKAGDISISGYIGTSTINRANRSMEVFFVNGRYIRSKQLSSALEEGYEGFCMQHQFPVAFIYLDIPPGSVDVNVHPTKQEVRIEGERDLYEGLRSGVHDRLSLREDIGQVELEEEKKTRPVPEPEVVFEPFETEKISDVREKMRAKLASEEREEMPDKYAKFKIEKKPEPVRSESDIRLSSGRVVYEQATFLSEKSKAEHRMIGQVFGTYFMIEYNGVLYMIDQHAAHEKVLFERTMKRLREDSITSQLVSPPVIVTLSSVEEQVLSEHMEDFEAMGYKVAHFGGHDYQISAVPGDLLSIDAGELFMAVISDAVKWGSVRESELIREKIASMSCKAAIKGNHRLSSMEMEELFLELMELDEPYHCPHGRPTMISFTRDELDKKFKRIVG